MRVARDADAGPTGLPWIDSNGWYVRLVRARVQTPVWLMLDPPGKGTVVGVQNYRMAVIDAEAAGARWVISLDDTLRAGLTEGNSSARQSWQQIVAAAGFFERHREWRSYHPLGLVGVISDFEGDNFTMSGEILNLMARRDLLHRVIWKTQAMAQPFAGLKALVYVDEAQPAPELRRKIVQFVEQGGLLVTTPRWGREGKSTTEAHPRFDVRAFGKGRLAISKEESIDPYVLAGDTQILLSHANDLVKFFNSSSSGCTQYATSPDGRKALLQGISYASGRGGGSLKTLWVRQRYASARLWLMDAAQAVSIEQKPAEDYSGGEYHLPAEAQGYIRGRIRKLGESFEWRSTEENSSQESAPHISGRFARRGPSPPLPRHRSRLPDAKPMEPSFYRRRRRCSTSWAGLDAWSRARRSRSRSTSRGVQHRRIDYIPAGRAFWTHPRTVGAVIHLLDKAGARRIRVVEGAMSWGASLEEFMLKTNWDPKLLLDAAPRVELINTNLPFPGKKPYARFAVPNGGHLFASYDLNTAYDECDVLVSMNKIKEHASAGITLSMKNCFGITPCTIYGNKAGIDEPGPVPFGGRQEIIHQGSRQPTKSAVSEKDPGSPRQGGYRIPRCIADLVAARPIHLCLLEGVETITGAELPRANVTRFVSPGILVAGTNCVTTDAVAAAVMGFDPMADRGTAPFERCDSTLRLAEELGVGTRDLSRIEVIGTPIREALFKFREVPRTGPQTDRKHI